MTRLMISRFARNSASPAEVASSAGSAAGVGERRGCGSATIGFPFYRLTWRRLYAQTRPSEPGLLWTESFLLSSGSGRLAVRPSRTAGLRGSAGRAPSAGRGRFRLGNSLSSGYLLWPTRLLDRRYSQIQTTTLRIRHDIWRPAHTDSGQPSWAASPSDGGGPPQWLGRRTSDPGHSPFHANDSLWLGVRWRSSRRPRL
jgi:hypothetical protein